MTMLQFEQGALDSLYAAKRALDRAINAYESSQKGTLLSVDDGPLFETMDNVDTAGKELQSFIAIALADQ